MFLFCLSIFVDVALLDDICGHTESNESNLA